jgi:hypothetical protein
MEKLGFLEKAGDRWWPVLGSVFILSAIKRVTTLTLVGKIEKGVSANQAQLSTVTQLNTTSHKNQLQNQLKDSA